MVQTPYNQSREGSCLVGEQCNCVIVKGTLDVIQGGIGDTGTDETREYKNESTRCLIVGIRCAGY